MAMKEIEHVVVLMLENRSFDSLLGWLYEHDANVVHNVPGAAAGDKFRGLQGVEPGAFINTATLTNGTAISSPPLRGVAGFTVPSVDPGEEFEHVDRQFFGAPPGPAPTPIPTMKGYLADYVEVMEKDRGLAEDEVLRRAKEVMQSYTPGQLPVLNQLARHYAVSDDWYASIPSQTNGNRAFSLCGTSLGLVNNGQLETNENAQRLESLVHMKIGDDRFGDTQSQRVDTIFNALAQAGIDWSVFWQTSYLPHKLNTLVRDLPNLVALLAPVNPALAAALGVLLAALTPLEQYLDDLTSDELRSCYTWRLFPQIEKRIANAAQHFQKIEDFHRRARAGTLPRFSYLEPFWTIAETSVGGGYKNLFTAMGNDYHPPGSTLVGERFLAEVYSSLIANRAAWEKTLFIVTFDEFVGTFDHVKPTAVATPPWGNGPAPVLPTHPNFDFKRFGGRVPALLISPWVQKNTVFRASGPVPYDHTSVIATTLAWLGQEAQIPNFGQRTQAAPRFDGVLALAQPRTDERAMPFMNTGRNTGELVRFGDPIVLRNQNGAYYSTAAKVLKITGGGSVLPDDVLGFAVDLNMAAFFPTLGTDKATMTLLSRAPDPAAQVDDGAHAMLVSLEPAVGDNNVLGTWSDSWDCYYANQYLEGAYADNQDWIVQQVERRGQPLRYGDKLYLENKASPGKRLSHDWRPGESGWISYSSGGDYWTIEPAAPAAVAPPPPPALPPPPAAGRPLAFWTMNGHTLTAVNGGGVGAQDTPQTVAALRSDATQIGPNETFRWVWLNASAGLFALQTANGHFVTAVNGGGMGGPNDATSPFHTDATWIRAWETFTLVHVDAQQGTVALRTASGNYVSAVNGGGVGDGGRNNVPIHTDAVRASTWETFRVGAPA